MGHDWDVHSIDLETAPIWVCGNCGQTKLNRKYQAKEKDNEPEADEAVSLARVFLREGLR